MTWAEVVIGTAGALLATAGWITVLAARARDHERRIRDLEREEWGRHDDQRR